MHGNCVWRGFDTRVCFYVVFKTVLGWECNDGASDLEHFVEESEALIK